MDKLTKIDIEILRASGLNVIEELSDSNTIAFEDPSCIYHVLDNLLSYASVISGILAGLMLTGWAVLYIKNGIKLEGALKNLRNLFLIFAVLGLTKPIVNFIYGENLLSKQCKPITVSAKTVLELKNQRPPLKTAVYDVFIVTDSGAPIDTSFLSENDDENDSDTDTLTDTSNSNTETPNITFTGIQQTSNAVIFIKPNGERIERSRGTVAWRHNNPGNIVNSKFAREHGAFQSSGKFAIFPDEQTGMNAIKSLLRSKGYINLSISQAIHKWAPAADNNNPERYTRNVANQTKLDPNRKISSLNDQELQAIANAIKKREGWKPGKERKL